MVCLYDSGFFNNWKEFWFGKMHENEFTRPPTSPYINEMIKKYQASLHKRGLPESNVFQAGSAHDGGCCENKHCDVEQGQVRILRALQRQGNFFCRVHAPALLCSVKLLHQLLFKKAN